MTVKGNSAGLSAKTIGAVSADQHGFTIEIDERFRPALEGLARFSHVLVTWWADRAEELETHGLVVAEPYVDGPAQVGVFATRSPRRPSPIALSVSRLLSVDLSTGTVALDWIDAIDGTPVIDLKPYFPSSDRVRDATVPPWFSSWPGCLEESADFDWESAFPRGH